MKKKWQQAWKKFHVKMNELRQRQHGIIENFVKESDKKKIEEIQDALKKM